MLGDMECYGIIDSLPVSIGSIQDLQEQNLEDGEFIPHCLGLKRQI